MFHIIESSSVTLFKNNTNRTLFAVPLGSNQLALITTDAFLTLYHLPTHQIIRKVSLPSMPRKVVSLKGSSIALIFPEDRSLSELSLGPKDKQSLSKIFEFEPVTNRLLPKSLVKEREFYSTMQLDSFLLSGNIFCRDQNPEYRRNTLRVFIKKEGVWQTHNKDLGFANRKLTKMDELGKLALYRDVDIDRNGLFTFKTIDATTLEEEEITLHSQSFTEYTVVVEVKMTSREEFFVQVNRKEPELLYFRNMNEHSAVSVRSNVLWVVNLGSIMLQQAYSLSHPQLMTMTLRRGLKTYDITAGKFQSHHINGEGMVVQFERERKDTSASKVVVHRMMSKNKLYLKLLSSFRKCQQHRYLFYDVLSLLDMGG